MTANAQSQPLSTHAPVGTFSWITALVCVACLFIVAVETCRPQLPRPLSLDIEFPAGLAGRRQPLITTGEYGSGDLLVVQYLEGGRAELAYDSWGSGGPTSNPFAYTPGQAIHATIEMPSISSVVGDRSAGPGQLRVSLNGATVLDGKVAYHPLSENTVYFGINGIGGTGEGSFSGILRKPDGRVVRGGAQTYFPFWVRITTVLRDVGQLSRLALLAMAAGFLLPLARRPFHSAAARVQPRPTGNSSSLWFWIPAAVAILAFAAIITGGTWRLMFPESFGDFYDYQALSLWHGRLDVPPAAVGGEAFVVGGKYYGYFGPTPALFRLPSLLFPPLFGKLSRLFMLAYFVATLFAARTLLRQAVRLTFGPTAQPSGWAVALLVTSTGLGSTFFFLGSRAYIYHEATLCGAMLALWAVYWALRYLEFPAGRAWIASLCLGLLSVHARPPSGLFALCVLGTVSLVHLYRGLAARWRASAIQRAETAPPIAHSLLIGISAAAAILSFNALSYAKFRTFDGAPLRYHIQYNPQRLARFDGKNFHAVNIPHNFYTYFVARSLHTKWHFPWFSIRGDSGWSAGEKMDMEEPTLSVPRAMPSLAAIILIGCAAALLFVPSSRPPLLVLSAGFAPPLVALLAAVATSHRYTADMCPYLIAAAAYGLAALESTPRWTRRGLFAAISALTLLSVLITVPLTLQYQAEGVWGVPASVTETYHQLRAAINHLIGLK